MLLPPLVENSIYSGETLCSIARLGNLFFQQWTHPPGFFTKIRQVRARDIDRKTRFIPWFARRWLSFGRSRAAIWENHHLWILTKYHILSSNTDSKVSKKITAADRCWELLERSGNQHSQTQNIPLWGGDGIKNVNLYRESTGYYYHCYLSPHSKGWVFFGFPYIPVRRISHCCYNLESNSTKVYYFNVTLGENLNPSATEVLRSLRWKARQVFSSDISRFLLGSFLWI